MNTNSRPKNSKHHCDVYAGHNAAFMQFTVVSISGCKTPISAVTTGCFLLFQIVLRHGISATHAACLPMIWPATSNFKSYVQQLCILCNPQYIAGLPCVKSSMCKSSGSSTPKPRLKLSAPLAGVQRSEDQQGYSMGGCRGNLLLRCSCTDIVDGPPVGQTT